ncbi:hypothetical protein CYFUS_006973 [Cystobacter fuscus]|uniref:DUF2169 domain-containing protein n=1 Tax=Cystobacter fuscus TaxID=43 RepID=A0A250JDA9_9BACT|nr:DUF2169 domain-containing protein [Cystobacter fuscus]ATB41507.1 hypothetical protein CYFUS_006973 [Cystobacter fuscus]
MGLAINNQTPFAVEPLALADEELRPLVVVVVKATYLLEKDGLKLADTPVPVSLTGETWGEPGQSSYRYEPETAFTKLATDVVLNGHAYAPARNTTELEVEVRVGPLRKVVRVVGDRVWVRSLGQVSMTRPLSFEKLPLVYERAFGGRDRTATAPANPQFEPHNPVGAGFRASPRHYEEGLRLPNLEDPARPLIQFGQRVPPVGFGFISPDWQPRAALAGTYDKAWESGRKPLLPRDFDRRYFNAASPGLVAPGYLQGNEPVLLVNASPKERLTFQLPGVRPRVCAALEGGPIEPVMSLDTVILEPDARRVLLLWRGTIPLEQGAHEVRGLKVWMGPGSGRTPP